MALFESYERRIDKINEVLGSYGIASIEEAEKITKDAGLDVYNQVKGIQPICFENACWAYIVGAAIAIKKGCKSAADAAAAIGEGLQAFCIPGSVADQRKVGLGHGNLGKMLLEEDTDCFAFLAGHESFAAAEGAIGIAEKANKVRKKPLRVILNGLGKDAAKIISRINGFTYVQTEYDYYTGELKEVQRIAYSDGLRSKVNCYGANDVREGVAIMHRAHEGLLQDAVQGTFDVRGRPHQPRSVRRRHRGLTGSVRGASGARDSYASSANSACASQVTGSRTGMPAARSSCGAKPIVENPVQASAMTAAPSSRRRRAVVIAAC